eukprot:CAMPEP_0174913936 /NCGR_PEP_ID=MMETSP0167-20121228/80579_1 /TAXON_ID=38298 /ORGANISM="Rhodella maculata, Strain CCMP736" /LENGTH=217 /DNA_ID=CAMNT_0016158679 /DNA_START=295 /DNA_END=948 /DNA_ORIENTATION=+
MLRRAANTAVTCLRKLPARHLGSAPTPPPFTLGKLHHVALAVPDLARASAFFADVLRAELAPAHALPSHGVTASFVELPGETPTRVELLEPLGDASPMRASAFFADVLRAELAPAHALPSHGVTASFVELPGETPTRVELLEPLGDASPMAGFLRKKPLGGVHHLCFEVSDVRGAVEHVKGMGVRVLGAVKVGAMGKEVVFLHPEDCGGVLVELQQE